MEKLELFIKTPDAPRAPRPHMVWWVPHKDAARYIVHVYVLETIKQVWFEIARIEKDRHTCYHTFTDLVNFGMSTISGYYDGCHVEVEAESPGGEIIAASGKEELR